MLTPLGAYAAQKALCDREATTQGLLNGTIDISIYSKGVCHDAAAFMRYMLGASISPDELVTTFAQHWLLKFAYKQGMLWNRRQNISRGSLVGFYRERDQKFFHSGIAIGGHKMRAVNGGLLGMGWSHTVDLNEALGPQTSDASFMYDGTPIKVYISRL